MRYQFYFIVIFFKLLKNKLIILTALFLFYTNLVIAQSSFIFSGQLKESSGEPISAALASFTVQIRSEGTGSLNCLLYQESHSNIALSNGKFSLTIGTGTRPSISVDGGLSFSSIFQNDQSINLTSQTSRCANSYTPNSNSRRILKVTYNDGTISDTLPDIIINSQTNSLYSLNSAQLGGVSFTQFLRVNGVTPSVISSSDYTNLIDLISGSSSLYLSPSAVPTCPAGQFISAANTCSTPTLSSALTTLISGNNYLTISNSAPNSTITANIGTSTHTLAAGDDSRIVGALQKSNNLNDLTNVSTARSNLGLGTTATLNAGTSANQILQLNSSSQIPAVDASLLTNITRSNISAGTANHVLINNSSGVLSSEAQLSISRGGTNSSTFSANSLIVANSDSSALTSKTCSSLEIIQWDGTQWICISILNSVSSTTFVQSGNSFSQNAQIGTNDNYDVEIKTNNISRVIVTKDGLLGVGTTTPQAKFEISGGQAVTAFYDASTSSTIDFDNGNMQETSAAAGTITLTHFKSGGNYTLFLTNATGGIYTLSISGFTLKCLPTCYSNQVSVNPGTHTIINFTVTSTTVYTSWVRGYN